MNVMFVLDGRLVTPSLEPGTILAGVTRDSLLALARAQGLTVEERMVSVDELADAQRAGVFQEMFACGTAAVVANLPDAPLNRLLRASSPITDIRLEVPR